MAKSDPEVRKRIAFERDVFDALQLLARDRTASLQELMDEAVADLLRKHHRPVSVREMLTAAAAELGDAHPKKSAPRKAQAGTPRRPAH